MNLLDSENTLAAEFFQLKKLKEYNTQLIEENLHLKMELSHLKIKVAEARRSAELDSKCAKGIRKLLGVKNYE